MKTATATMKTIQDQIDNSGLYHASLEGGGIIHAIARDDSRRDFYVRVGVRGGITFWTQSEDDAAKGKDAKACLSFATFNHNALGFEG